MSVPLNQLSQRLSYKFNLKVKLGEEARSKYYKNGLKSSK